MHLKEHILFSSLLQGVVRLNPIRLWASPIMLLTEIAALATTLLAIAQKGGMESLFNWQIAILLWITVYFATFSESLAEARGKADVKNLKTERQNLLAKRLKNDGSVDVIDAKELLVGDCVVIDQGDMVPCDGEILEGTASIDESKITGESQPVIRSAGGDRSGVTAGTVLLSDRLVVQVISAPGQTALDKMIALVEGAVRQRTPNEIALSILLLLLSLLFIIVVVAIPVCSHFLGHTSNPVMLFALLVSLLPTTIGGLLPAIGIAGMNRLMKINVLAYSGHAVEAAGDVDIVMFDKTGTITLGNRKAVAFYARKDISVERIEELSYLACLGDETAEGKSVHELLQEKEFKIPKNYSVIPFSASNRYSGITFGDTEILKGAVDALSKKSSLPFPSELQKKVSEISFSGGTPLAVMENNDIVGVIHLKDVIKTGLKPKLAVLQQLGIHTVMVTGDNPVTAQAIADEAGIDEVIAEATPENKLEYIKLAQEGGHMVAMCGDGTNDAPALAQADVAIAMQSGTAAAKDAANMIDLDSDPTKLIQVISTGKQLLMTRGALTTFSIANDIAKYFAIIPALFMGFYPELRVLNVMHLHTPQSAVLSAVIFNAFILILLLPLALQGVPFRPAPAAKLLKHNLLIYGVGGVIIPFMGIKAIDSLLAMW